MPHNPWSAVLVQMRKQQRLTQEKAAEGAEVSKNTWYRWENVNFNPTDKNLKKAARAFGCTIEELQAAHRAEMPPGDHDLTGLDPDDVSKIRAGRSLHHSIRRLLGDDVAGDPVVERLLGRSPEADPSATPEEKWTDLFQHVTVRTQVLVSASAQILTDIYLCYPQLEHAATEEEKEHFARLNTLLLDHLKLSRLMTESLHEIGAIRLAARRAAFDEEFPPDDF